MSRSRVARWLVRSEPWLPLAIGAAWWAAMYPGLYGEDSLINLTEAQRGPISVWFTAWWVYVIRAVTIGGRVIPLLTLGSVIVLVFAVREWVRACFLEGPARALALCLICATPLVGAMGIQVRHDIPMAAGLLLSAAVMTRSSARGGGLVAADYLQLALAVALLATRHNGLPTMLGAALCAVVFAPRADRMRWIAICVAVSVSGAVVTQAATRVAGQPHSIDPLQSVEWTLGDLSCLLSKPAVRVSQDDWAALGAIATPADWPSRDACRFIDNALLYAPTFNRAAIDERPSRVFAVWLALAARNPRQMLAAHAERVRLFLPPFVTGAPAGDNTPFIHSTILPNTFGLRWAFPRLANVVRLLARAWNAGRLVLANAALWLIALAAVAWRYRGEPGVRLRATMLLALSLELGIVATAPISEGRYGLFILICGQTAALLAGLESCNRWLQT